jgi:hypothetical protein
VAAAHGAAAAPAGAAADRSPVHLSRRFENPRSSLDAVRICPILDFVEVVMEGRFRPQLLRVVAYEDGRMVGSTLVTDQAVQWAMLGYRYATHLEVEHLGNA